MSAAPPAGFGSLPATVSILGSTGSIGTQALDVIRHSPDRSRVVGIAAHSSVDKLAAQAAELLPERVAIADPELEADLRAAVPKSVKVLSGPEAFAELAVTADVVLNAVVGFAGLPVTLAALTAGKRLALANKESLIAAGPVVQKVRATPGAEIVPVDSEHCAVHQCLRSGRPSEVAKIVLTASGGPFRGASKEELAEVTVADALAHPTWNMGPKITVDSSTLMNKGLEVIEAHELFGVGYDAIDVVVHPQSIVHSMVEFSDGATMAQLSQPDMRLPIAYALGFPHRSARPIGRVDWARLGSLDFDVPDTEVFRCLPLAYEAGRTGGTAPAWLNAANEIAVAAFLEGLISWASIADVVEDTLQGHDGAAADTAEDVIEADRRSRERARRTAERRAAA